MSRREKEVFLKAEAGEAARRANAIADARAAELENKTSRVHGRSRYFAIQIRGG